MSKALAAAVRMRGKWKPGDKFDDPSGRFVSIWDGSKWVLVPIEPDKLRCPHCGKILDNRP